jgi:hypothetical protein
MSLDETFRRRKPVLKALLPWPGFFLLDQYLPDRLLGLQRKGFCPLQIAGQCSGGDRMFQLGRKGIVDSLSPIQIAPQQRNNDQSAKGNVRQHIQGSPCAHSAPAAKAQPAVPPDPNRSEYKVLHGLHPSPVSAMGMKTSRIAEAFVTDCGLLRSTAVGTLMKKKHVGSKDQPILKTRFKTHWLNLVSVSYTGIHQILMGMSKEKKDRIKEKRS